MKVSEARNKAQTLVAMGQALKFKAIRALATSRRLLRQNKLVTLMG